MDKFSKDKKIFGSNVTQVDARDMIPNFYDQGCCDQVVIASGPY